jgi:hypothetical protein
MKQLAFGPGDDYAGKPGPQGDDLPGCVLATLNAITSAIVIALLLFAGNPIHAAPFATEPIIGPAPCHSDTLWGCYANRLYLPVVNYDGIVVGDDATPEPVIITPTPTSTPTPTATVTPVAQPTVTLVIVTVTP